MGFKEVEATASAYTYPLLIKNILSAPLVHAPNKEIVYRDKVRYTYRTLEERVAKLAYMLEDLGVKPGNTVAVMDWDSNRYLECFFAVPMLGAVLHTVNVRFSKEQLVYTINHAEDDVLMVNTDFLPVIEAVKHQLKTVKKIVLLTDAETPISESLDYDGEYEQLLGLADDSFDFPDFDEHTIATSFYTAGIDGFPKGVFFSHRQLVLHTYGLLSGLCGKPGFNINSADVYMPLTPMFHVHAWGVPYLCTMLGTKQVYPGHYETDMLIQLINNEGVTFSHCVPTVMYDLISSPSAKQVDWSQWKIVVGGAALSPSLCKKALAMNINVISAYGLSETCPLLTLSSLKEHMLDWDIDRQVEIRCKAGLPVPYVQLELFDYTGNPVPHDGKSTGEVVVRAPWLTQGYRKDAQKSEELWTGGWLHTGDIGNIDREGYLQITDRTKDAIKIGGEWISSYLLENIICQHPGVSEAAVIGIPDEKWGEKPLAMVVLKESFRGKVNEDDLKNFCRSSAQQGKIPHYSIPERFSLVESLAKSGVGKISKRELRHQLAR